jgi:hypothetical protein
MESPWFTNPDLSIEYSLGGLERETAFDEAVTGRLRAESSATDPNELDKRRELLAAAGSTIDELAAPKSSDLALLKPEDWELIGASPQPLLAAYGAANFRRQLEGVLSVKRSPVRIESVEQLAFSTQAELRSFGLVHQMSAAAFEALAQAPAMTSNKTRYQASGQSPLEFRDSRVGATNSSDREFGLDQYVFFDWPRPASHHKAQAEITLVVDPAVMSQPGTFMTEQDIADAKGVRKYMEGGSTSEYFYATAAMRVLNSVTHTSTVYESYSGQSEQKHFMGSLDQFASGIDGQKTSMEPGISAYEVKVPDPPGVAVQAIRRVIVRDPEAFDRLVGQFGDQFEFVCEPNLHPATLQNDDDLGNYDLLRVPGAYERAMEELKERDYAERVQRLGQLADDDKEEVLMVFGRTDPSETDPSRRVDIKTNPAQFDRVAVYKSIDEVGTDVGSPYNLNDMNLESSRGQPVWFGDRAGILGIRTRSGNCVIAQVQRSKLNPTLCQVLETGSLNLDQLNAVGGE